jgi:cation diffusion facilitator CzcD-associated flavoprotein CzcO
VERSSAANGRRRDLRVAILGAGAGGLCMAIGLRRAGLGSFTLFEKSGDVGGTWHDKRYPGAACDVPSHLYSFSFEQKPDWSRVFSPQAEIQAYLRGCAEKYGVLPHVRLRTEVQTASFDERAGVWRLRTAAGEEVEADVVVSGLGQLNRPRVPDLQGLASFEGASFHSARWDHGVDLAGRRVAVVGNAASAIQFIPQIAVAAAQVDVYQRTANWTIPRGDRAYSEREKRLFASVPGLERLYRWLIWAMLETRFFAFREGSWLGRRIERAARDWLHSQVRDPALRTALTPDYPVGCKRILISDDYYAALGRPNVALVTSPIERVTPSGVVTRDGRERAADVLILATGFETTSFLAPLEVEGVGGCKLQETWRGGAEAYLGVAVAGFPNLFMLYGPNTNLGHNSILFMIECQVNYIVQCLRELARRDAAWLDVRPEAQERFNRELQSALAKTAWAAGCASWYKTDSGKITNNWSGFTLDYWRRMRRPDWSAFRMGRGAG